MITAVTVLAFVIIACALLRHLEAGAFERATWVLTLAAVLWLATVWSLALVHGLTRPMLIVRSLIVVAIAVILVVSGKVPFPRWNRDARAIDRIAVISVVVWVLFVLIRAAIVPPVSHDALAYHLPKALLYSRAHGFAYFPFLNEQIRGIPANYEMLLADVLTVEKSDATTEWPSVYFYIAFVVSCAALAERWWGRSRIAIAVAAASLPVALLQAGAHKNDLMVAALAVAGVVAAGRFFTTGQLTPLFLSAAAFAAAVGTKPQAAIVALAVIPFVLWRLRGARAIASIVAFSIIAFLLLGGVVYIANLTHRGESKDTGALAIGTALPYGDFSNLWQAPYVIAAAPFSTNEFALRVPWETSPWFWRRYELYFAHLGIPFAICLVLLPLAIFAFARRATAEAKAMSTAMFVALLVILPTHFDPHGMFTISLPRYMLFFVPVVLAWTLGPLERWHVAVVAVLLLFFVYYAIDFTRNDRFQPWPYVVWAAKHPGTRVVPFDVNRAALVFDRHAGPNDTVAIDAAFGSWIYPAFGKTLERKVEFIAHGPGAPQIPDDAQWVIVDRGFQAVWQNPEFRDLSQARQFLMRGKPTPDDLRVINSLLADRRFQTVYYDRNTNQAVFRRNP
jgi:hypothetical protein